MIPLLACILAGMVLEGIALLAWHHRTGGGLGPGALLPNLAAGACLLLAMLLALEAAWWPLTAACLGGALVAHILDLTKRWPAFPPPARGAVKKDTFPDL